MTIISRVILLLCSRFSEENPASKTCVEKLFTSNSSERLCFMFDREDFHPNVVVFIVVLYAVVIIVWYEPCRLMPSIIAFRVATCASFLLKFN